MESILRAPRRPEASAVPSGLRETVLERLETGAVDLPAVPVLALRVMELVRDDRATVLALTELIQKDQVIASRLLRVSNTMQYTSGKEVRTLGEAVVRVGLREVRNIVLGLTLGSCLEEGSAVYGEDGRLTQAHAIGAAYCARAVAAKAGIDPQEAFLCGLLHDLGRLVVRKLAWDAGFRGAGSGAEVEALVEECHALAGGRLLARWRLPAAIYEAVRWHHLPSAATASPGLARATHAADRLCHLLGFGRPPEALDLASEGVFVELGLDEAWLGSQVALLPALFQVATEIFA